MKKVIVFLLVAALLSVSSGAWAQQASNSGVVATATATGLDGKPIQVVDFSFTDTWRQNRYYSVTQTLTSDQLRFPGKPWNAKTNPYEVKAVTIATSNMSGNGLGRDAAVGAISNAPLAAGIGFGLRYQNVPEPDRTTVTQNTPVNVKNTGVNKPVNAQSQFQTGPTNVNTPVNINAPVNNLNQAQAQTTGLFSPASAIAP